MIVETTNSGAFVRNLQFSARKMKVEELTESANRRRKILMKVSIANIVLGIVGIVSILLLMVGVVGGVLSYRRLKKVRKSSGTAAFTTAVLILGAAALLLASNFIFGAGGNIYDGYFRYVVMGYEGAMVLYGAWQTWLAGAYKAELEKCVQERRPLLADKESAPTEP